MPTIHPLRQLRFAEILQTNDVVAWPQGPGEPLALTEALVAQGHELQNPALLFGLTASNTLQPALTKHFRLKALNGAGNSRKVTAYAEILPCHVSSLPGLLRAGDLAANVVLIQVRPLSRGLYTLGVIADFTQELIRQARLVVALLNPALPATAGDAVVREDDIDLLVEADHRLLDMPDPEPSDIERLVARRVAELVPDRATVQLGIGTLPAAVAAALSNHRQLGVHSGVVSDALVTLVERGVVTNAHKGRDSGRTVTGGLFGTQRLRDFAERNRCVEMRSVEYTHNHVITASLLRFHAINSAIEIDLTGQANAEIAGNRYLGAVGGQVDFVRGGNSSFNGHSIMALPSATPNGEHSRIVSSLSSRPVTTTRSDADIVVTEYGVARLRGCSLGERARRLAAIAHPAHQEALLRDLHDARF